MWPAAAVVSSSIFHPTDGPVVRKKSPLFLSTLSFHFAELNMDFFLSHFGIEEKFCFLASAANGINARPL